MGPRRHYLFAIFLFTLILTATAGCLAPAVLRRGPATVTIGGLFLAGTLFWLTLSLRRYVFAVETREAQLRLLAEALPMFISYVDREGRYRFVNPTYEKYFGLPAEKLLEKTVPELVGPEVFREIKADFDAALAGSPRQFERVFSYREHTFPIRGWFLPDIDARGYVRGYLGIIQDIREEKHLAESIREEKRLVETFRRIGSVLTAELDLRRLLQILTDLTTDLSGAKFGCFLDFTPAQREPPLCAWSGISGSPEVDIRVFEAMLRERKVIRSEDIGKDPRNKNTAGFPVADLPVASFLAVPVVSRSGEVRGGLFFGHPASGVFTQRAEQLLVGVAAQAAIAIDNAQLYRQSRQSERRYRFLADAGNLLASSLDYERTLQTTATLSLPQLGDVCIAQILQDDGSIQRVTAVVGDDDADPKRRAWAQGVRDLIAKMPLRPSASSVFETVVRTGKSVVLSAVNDASLRPIAKDEAHLAAMWATAPKASMAMPLLVGGKALGSLSFVRHTDENPYSETEIQLAEQLAQRAALAVENARLYREARAAVEQEQRARAELQRSNAELEQFAYVASHDLKEPLRMVASYVQLLARRYSDRIDDEGRDFVRFAVGGVGRMRQLIDDLQELSRVRTKARPFETVASRLVVDAAVENLHSLIEEVGAQVVAEDLPTVAADPVQLTQLFQNLIGNGIKYRRESPPRIRVTAKPAEGDTGWIFSVSDNGIGIDRENFERIFVVFQRLHAREEYSGTGIGLSLCKKIVERHGGQIWVESRVGEGSTFSFRLPKNLRTRVESELQT